MPGLFGKDLVQHGQQPIVLARTEFRLPLGQAVMLQRPAAVGRLLEDHLVDQLPCLHAPQRQEAVGPSIGRLADELSHGLGPIDAGFSAEFKVGIDHLPGLPIHGRQVRHLVHLDRLPVAPHADGRQALLQIAWVPVAGGIIGTFQQVPEFQADRLQNFFVLRLHQISPQRLRRNVTRALTRGIAIVVLHTHRSRKIDTWIVDPGFRTLEMTPTRAFSGPRGVLISRMSSPVNWSLWMSIELTYASALPARFG